MKNEINEEINDLKCCGNCKYFDCDVDDQEGTGTICTKDDTGVYGDNVCKDWETDNFSYSRRLR